MNPQQKLKMKKGKKSKSKASAAAPVVQKQVSLGRTLLRSGGSALGGLFGLGKVGRSVGDFVADITGMGAYKVNSNTIMKGSDSVPSFTHSDDSVVISHREYVRDVYGSINFNTRTYEVNPTNSELFPFLAPIASNFEQYEFLGLVIAFNPTAGDAIASTNNALGSVVMSTQYDVTRSPFASKFEMENYEYSCSGKPSEPLLHPIECNPKQDIVNSRYTHGVLKTDSTDRAGENLVDIGKFQIATVGQQAADINIGELWCTYKVRLLKPRIPGTSQYLGDFHAGSDLTSTFTTGGGASMLPFGLGGTVTFTDTTQSMSRVYIDSNRLYLEGIQPLSRVQITYTCQFYNRSNTSAAYLTTSASTLTNCDPDVAMFTNFSPLTGAGFLSTSTVATTVLGQQTMCIKTRAAPGVTAAVPYVTFGNILFNGVPDGTTANFIYDIRVVVLPAHPVGRSTVLGSSDRVNMLMTELRRLQMRSFDRTEESSIPVSPTSQVRRVPSNTPTSLRVRSHRPDDYEIVSHLHG